MQTYTPALPSYAHQIAALRDSWSRPGYGFLMEMGTGKSKVIIDNICMLRELGGLHRAVILAPKGTYANWTEKEIPTHLPERHKMSAVVHLWEGGGSRTEQRALGYLMEDGDELRILVMNTEAVSQSSRAREVLERFVRMGKCLVAVDESTTIKNPQAVRTKKITAIGRHAEWRRIATGSPVTRNPLDLFSQFEFLQPRCLGSSNFYAFRARFAITAEKEFGGRRVTVVVGHRDTEHLSRIVACHAFVVRKEDCLDLPPKIYQTRYVEMTPEQARLYADVRDWCTAEISAGNFVSTQQVITQMLRLHQIAIGHVVDEAGETTELPTRRLEVLEEILEEAGDKVIVWCHYRRDVERVIQHLRSMGRRPVRYDGSTTMDERKAAVLAFQEGDATDFVGTTATGGYGITLTAAATVVYYSCGPDYEKRVQSEDRAHRIGQTRSVNYVDLVVKDSVEERILGILRNKESLANLIMDGPARVRELLG